MKIWFNVLRVLCVNGKMGCGFMLRGVSTIEERGVLNLFYYSSPASFSQAKFFLFFILRICFVQHEYNSMETCIGPLLLTCSRKLFNQGKG